MLAPTIVMLAGYYLAVGVVTAVLFAGLVQRIEPSARGGSAVFRLLILPGASLLWPMIWLRVLRFYARRQR